ncbi:histidine utilization repressor [Allorhizobium sp. BGMRC 0089]|uniref:histidine utilization repressor n=1 Tax=Allorhizobium sonneratiae TaxID=2934936 RepID=UPI0020338EEF|nr:histidine utilization repressor [Allorhizobium sonneratiae]MCM2294110.1 histidine utilization repressor [Allorhizobium sonneratiae]
MTSKTTQRSTLHQTILADLERKIVSGEWPPGYRLPFEVDLAKSYDVSRMTVNKVMTQLTKAGLIERRKKSGSFVAHPRGQSAILEITDVEAEVRALNLPYAYRLLVSAVRKADRQDAALLDVPERTHILALSALHLAGDEPFCLEERLINLETVPEAANAPFEDGPAGAWLVQQVPWSAAEHKIFALSATGETAKRLQVPNRTACLFIQRRTWSEAGPVTFVGFTYPGEKHAIIASFTPAAV